MSEQMGFIASGERMEGLSSSSLAQMRQKTGGITEIS
jgi:hypothetical protein